MVFELCERWSSLSVQALGTVAAEFHEDARTASLAADTVSLPVERFQVSTVGAFVVNEFNHTSLSPATATSHSNLNLSLANAFLSSLIGWDGHDHQLASMVELNQLHAHSLNGPVERVGDEDKAAAEFKVFDEEILFLGRPRTEHGVQQARPPTRPGIKRIRLPASKFMPAMSAALTSWSFTNTQEPWVWLAFSATSACDI